MVSACLQKEKFFSVESFVSKASCIFIWVATFANISTLWTVWFLQCFQTILSQSFTRTLFCWMSMKYCFIDIFIYTIASGLKHYFIHSCALILYIYVLMIILICVIFILSSLSKLSQLKVLNLQESRFIRNVLPSVIGELTSLEKLQLDNCNIEELPAGWV